jgi:hypothetical protein
LDEAIHCKTDYGSSKPTSCVNNAVGDSPLFVEILSRYCRNHLYVVSALLAAAVHFTKSLTMKQQLHPIPINTPAVKNSAPTFLVEKPLNTSPTPKNPTPSSAVLLPPILLISLAFTNAKNEIQAAVRLPTNDKLAGLERFSSTRAA